MDVIITSLIMSVCVGAIVGTLVYFIFKKKHDEDINWLFNMICDNKTEVYRFHSKYQDHLFEQHTSE